VIIPFKPEHLLAIRYQEGQRGGAQSRENAEALIGGWRAYTAILPGSAQPLACAGIVELWPARAMAWSALDFEAGKVMLEITRRMRAELDVCPYTRVEMYVRPGFPEGWRWARMFGFELESCMKRGAPDGGDLLVMTRFKSTKAYRDLKWNSRSLRFQSSRQPGL
jgi:hypothetical protein